MSHSSNVVYIASKLYEARDGMRHLFGAKYGQYLFPQLIGPTQAITKSKREA